MELPSEYQNYLDAKLKDSTAALFNALKHDGEKTKKLLFSAFNQPEVPSHNNEDINKILIEINYFSHDPSRLALPVLNPSLRQGLKNTFEQTINEYITTLLKNPIKQTSNNTHELLSQELRNAKKLLNRQILELVSEPLIARLGFEFIYLFTGDNELVTREINFIAAGELFIQWFSQNHKVENEFKVAMDQTLLQQIGKLLLLNVDKIKENLKQIYGINSLTTAEINNSEKQFEIGLNFFIALHKAFAEDKLASAALILTRAVRKISEKIAKLEPNKPFTEFLSPAPISTDVGFMAEYLKHVSFFPVKVVSLVEMTHEPLTEIELNQLKAVDKKISPVLTKYYASYINDNNYQGLIMFIKDRSESLQLLCDNFIDMLIEYQTLDKTILQTSVAPTPELR